MGTNGVARFETCDGVSVTCSRPAPRDEMYLIGDNINTTVSCHGNDGIERTKINPNDGHGDLGDE